MSALSGDALTEQIIGRAIEVHRQSGPGLLESAYERCVCFELGKAGIPHQSQAPLSAMYKGVRLETAFRADILVADEVIVEIKAVERLLPVHDAQVLTYLRMTPYHVGLLMNFNMHRLKDGLRRFVV